MLGLIAVQENVLGESGGLAAALFRAVIETVKLRCLCDLQAASLPAPFPGYPFIFKTFHCHCRSGLAANFHVIIISVPLKFIYLCNFNPFFSSSPKPIHSNMLTAAL